MAWWATAARSEVAAVQFGLCTLLGALSAVSATMQSTPLWWCSTALWAIGATASAATVLASSRQFVERNPVPRFAGRAGSEAVVPDSVLSRALFAALLGVLAVIALAGMITNNDPAWLIVALPAGVAGGALALYGT